MRLLVLFSALLLLSQARAETSCVRRYTDAFVALNNLASDRRLKAETAQAEVSALFADRPALCEPGGYGFFLDQVLLFARRALRSGATEQSAKEGWVRAAAATCEQGPRAVSAEEFPEALLRFHGAEREVFALIDAGDGGPVAALLLAALPLCAPLPVVEPEPAPPPLLAAGSPRSDEAEADLQVTRATALFRAADFDQAQGAFERAYELRPRPIYLFNIAQCHRRAGRHGEALRTYRDFLARAPGTRLRAETQGYIAELERLLGEAARAEAAERERASAQAQSAAAVRALSAEQVRALRAERELRRPVYRRPWFWGVLVTSLAAAAGGVTLAVIFTRDPPTDGGIVNLHF